MAEKAAKKKELPKAEGKQLTTDERKILDELLGRGISKKKHAKETHMKGGRVVIDDFSD